MKDASGKKSTAISVALFRRSDTLVYSITPDPAWLSAARFPITIDPPVAKIRNPDTAVITDSGTFLPGISADYSDTGDHLAVQAPGEYNPQYKKVALIHFGQVAYAVGNATPSLPLDSEVFSASLHLETYDGQLGSDDEPQIQALGLAKLPQSGVAWYAVGPDPAVAVTEPAVTLNPPWSTMDLDVTDIVEDWAESRNREETILIQQPADPTNAGPFDLNDGSDSVSLFLIVNYQPGWCTFQGNGKHTGRTQYEIPRNARLAWSTTALTTNGNTTLPPLLPSVIAVPRADNANLPSLYAAMTNGSGLSTVYRIQDNGEDQYGNPIAPTITSQRIIIGEITGTPLCYAGKLYVTGNDSLGGFMYVLDAGNVANAAWQNDPVNHPQPVRFVTTGPGNTVYSSPTVNPLKAGIIVSSNAPDGHAYVFCKNAATGLDVSGWATGAWPNPRTTHLYDTDDGQPRFAEATYSTPCVVGSRLYIGNGSGYLISRALADGEDEEVVSTLNYLQWDATIHSSITAWNGNLFVSGVEDQYAAGAPCISLKEYPDFANGTRWLYTWDNFYPVECWNSPAIDSNYADPLWYPAVKGLVVFMEESGMLNGLGADGDPLSPGYPKLDWRTPPVDSSFTHSSPLVAGTTSGDRTVFAVMEGADGGTHVSAYDAQTGERVVDYLGNANFNGRTRSSMAAFKGRLYVLVAGRPGGTLGGGTAAQLHCFSAP